MVQNVKRKVRWGTGDLRKDYEINEWDNKLFDNVNFIEDGRVHVAESDEQHDWIAVLIEMKITWRILIYVLLAQQIHKNFADLYRIKMRTDLS
jgi:hypothetical protein